MATRARSIQGEQLFDPDKALRNYDDQFLECRDLRHPWQVVGYFRQSGEVHRRLQCSRCPTVRIDSWTTGGYRLGSRYEYPDGYQFDGAGTHVDTTAVRREVLRRSTVHPSAQALVEATQTRR